MNKEEAIYHYINYGIYENRLYIKKKLPKDFNWIKYVLLNQPRI